MKKFPNDCVSQYTGISGFLFLRFFVPAVLGPRLFGLKVGIHLSLMIGHIDARGARTLTLISKTIQNLANIIEFGQKEVFMAPMNGLIRDKMEDMKSYLNSICISTSTENSSTGTSVRRARSLTLLESVNQGPPSSRALAQDSAELYQLFASNFDKLNGADPDSPLIDKFGNALHSIQVRLDSLSDMKSVIVDDVGRPVLNERESHKESEDQRRMISTLHKAYDKNLNINGSLATIVPYYDLKIYSKQNLEADPTTPQLPFSIISTGVGSSSKSYKGMVQTNSTPSLMNGGQDNADDGSMDMLTNATGGSRDNFQSNMMQK